MGAIWARAAWFEVYPALSAGQPGLFGAVTARGGAGTPLVDVRLALLDGSSVHSPPTSFSRSRSVGIRQKKAHGSFFAKITLGDPIADQILQAVREAVWGNPGPKSRSFSVDTVRPRMLNVPFVLWPIWASFTKKRTKLVGARGKSGFGTEGRRKSELCEVSGNPIFAFFAYFAAERFEMGRYRQLTTQSLGRVSPALKQQLVPALELSKPIPAGAILLAPRYHGDTKPLATAPQCWCCRAVWRLTEVQNRKIWFTHFWNLAQLLGRRAPSLLPLAGSTAVANETQRLPKYQLVRFGTSHRNGVTPWAVLSPGREKIRKPCEEGNQN